MSPTETSNVVAEGLAAVAARTPDELALCDDHERFSFAELDALAGTVARQLLERTGAGQVVPVIADRSAGSVVAVHGVLRAGRPVVIIDADVPKARVAHLLHRLSDPEVAVVGHRDGEALIPFGVTTLMANQVADPIGPQGVDPDDLAFVIFTSGSTGNPKGVMHSWSNLAAIAARRRMRLGERGFGHIRSLSAPLSYLAGMVRVVELSTGASVLVKDVSALGPAELLEWYDEQQLETIALVPSLASTLTGAWPSGRRLEHVRLVTTHGEALTWEQVSTLRQLIPDDASIEAGYATSEAPRAAIRYRIDPDTPLGRGRVPLGRDPDPDRLRLEPWRDDPDDPHEIVLRGNVAMGYLGEPELTAERFFTDDEGQWCWRSGDLASVNAAGELVHRGRKDDMVKINGKLVEPAEAERVILGAGGVADAVVLAHSATPGRRAHLVAPDIEVHEVGGDHRSMLEPPHATEVAEVVARVCSPLASTRLETPS